MNNVLRFFIEMKDMMSGGLTRLARQSNTSLGGVQRDLEATMRANHRLANSFGEVERRGKASFGRLGDFVKGNLIAGGIQKLWSMGVAAAKDVYQTTLKDGAIKTALNATTGGQGAEAVKMTRGIADKYGLSYEASMEGAKTLTGGLKGMNMPLKEQMQIFEGVSAGMAAMQLDAETQKGALLALGQMASKGTVQAEELRGQLGERIPGAFGLAAKAMGVTEMELNKMLQRGEVVSKDFLPKFAAEMQKTFGEDALKAATGPQAIQTRFENAMYDVKTTIGHGLMPVITPLIMLFTSLATSALPMIQEGITWITDGIFALQNGTSGWSNWLNLVKEYANMIWQNIMYIGNQLWPIVAGVVEWVQQSQLLQDIFFALMHFANFLWGFVKGVADVLLWTWQNVLKPILDGVEWLYRAAKDLLGFGGKELTVATKQTVAVANTPGAGLASAVTPIDTKTGAAVGSGPGNDVATGITSGGPRVVNIHIGKMVEKLEVHASGVQQGLNNLERQVEEVFLRILNSGGALQ